jgi:hypothetical protein
MYPIFVEGKNELKADSVVLRQLHFTGNQVAPALNTKARQVCLTPAGYYANIDDAWVPQSPWLSLGLGQEPRGVFR